MHLRVLAQISRLLKDEEFRKAFLAADDSDALWALLKSV
jgi:PTS system nitrogen regulatory IIA component